jgi:hypothetical protein
MGKEISMKSSRLLTRPVEELGMVLEEGSSADADDALLAPPERDNRTEFVVERLEVLVKASSSGDIS